jgi:ATP-dependent DNA helicase RecQ
MLNVLTTELQSSFGFTEFRPGQLEAIQNLLAGNNSLVVMPTGSGKSLIYQFLALRLTGITLVISPLIALMKDQVDSLERRHILATFINSALPPGEQNRRLEKLAQGAYRLIYIAPERLRSRSFLEALRKQKVDLLAVDEAHCISEWGHDFRPDYLHIAAVRAALGNPLTVALTATATPKVQDDITRLLGLEKARRIVTGFNRPNLVFEVRYIRGLSAKLKTLRELLCGCESGGSIIYTGTRHDAEETSDFVNLTCGVRAEYYHAGLPADERIRVQDNFLSGKLPVVTATNAFGMGIDRPDVRQVIHYSLPGSLEAYYQEAGRAGRDGCPARVVLLYDPQDRALQEWFIENSKITPADLHTLYDAVQTGENSKTWLTSEELSRLTGFPDVKLRLALAALERAGVVERLGDEGMYMLLHRNTWNNSAIQAAINQMQALQNFKREQLARMVAYAETNSCRRKILLDYFGDRSPADAPDCCDNCRAKKLSPVTASAIPGSKLHPVSADIAGLGQSQQVAFLLLDTIQQVKPHIGHRKLAQILHGSTASDICKFHYNQNKHYGKLSEFRQSKIEGLIEELVGGGYVKVVGGKYPVLVLTPQGEEALHNMTDVPLELPGTHSPEATAPKKAKRHSGSTYEITAQLFAQGLTPSEIVQQRKLSIGTIYQHLARWIAAGKIPVETVVPLAVLEQVEAAIQKVGNSTSLWSIKMQLPETIDYNVIRCVVEGWKLKQANVAATSPVQTVGGQDIDSFLSQPHPRRLPGPWHAGWAIDFHSRYAGADWSRSTFGDLTYRLKYIGDLTTLPKLVDQAVALAAIHPELVQVDEIMPVPPSTTRPLDPVSAFSAALAQRLGLPVVQALVKSRSTTPQKEMHTLAQKRANVAGAFRVQGEVAGRSFLIVDDLYDSGATLEEIARLLQRSGATRVCVLTLTRTIHSDG